MRKQQEEWQEELQEEQQQQQQQANSLLSKASESFFVIKEEEELKDSVIEQNKTQLYHEDMKLTVDKAVSSFLNIKFVLNHRLDKEVPKSFGIKVRDGPCPRGVNTTRNFMCFEKYMICEVLPSQ